MGALTPSAQDPRLIDAGQSERGWSWYGDYHLCLKYGALRRIAKLDDNAPPLVKGSLGHVLMAHQHVTWQCKQQGTVNPYYPPEEAAARWCHLHPAGGEYHDQMVGVFRRYLAKRPEPPGRIVGVEHPIKAILGYVGGVWGLWVVHPSWADWLTVSWRTGDPKPHAWVGGEITPTTLDMPGHRWHGAPIFMTRRLDLIIQDRGGYSQIWDWKFKSSVTSKSATEYEMDGQFAAARLFGRQMYGEKFGHAYLGAIQVGDPYAVKILLVEDTPWRDGLFAGFIHRKAHEVARLEVELPDPHLWPMAQQEQVCYRRFGGRCSFADACKHGPAALAK